MLNCYYMDLNCDCSNEQSLALYEGLPSKRKEHIDRLKNPEMKRNQILSGAFMQYGVGRALGIPKKQVDISYNVHGKPFVSPSCISQTSCGHPVYFNLSHSGAYAVLAVSDREVGIDIEGKSSNYLSVARRFFCPEEYADITDPGDEAASAGRFLEYWTMKEAYVKYVGKGLLIPLHSFRMVRNDDGYGLYIRSNREEAEQERNGGKCGASLMVKDDTVGIRVFCFADTYRIAVCGEEKRGIADMRRSTFVENANVKKVDVSVLF